MANTYNIYIILLNWNGWQDTVRCLESIFRSNYKDYRVVVCDNHSSDGSMEYLKQWANGTLEVHEWSSNRENVHESLKRVYLPPVPKPVEYWEPNPQEGAKDNGPLVLIQTGSNNGFAAGNNVGIRFALTDDPDYIWLLNNDTLIEPNTLSTLHDFMNTHISMGLAGASIFQASHPATPQTIGGGKLRRITGTDYFTASPGAIHYVTGTSLFIRKQVIHDIGLLDEGFFFYWEDTDYSTRAKHAGWEIGTSLESIVYHKHSASVGGQSLKSDLFKIASLSRYFKKHKPLSWWFPVTFNLLGMLVKRVLRGQFNRIAPILKEAFKRNRSTQA